nr:hypothetical protein [uncultured Campylobacter sp.]
MTSRKKQSRGQRKGKILKFKVTELLKFKSALLCDEILKFTRCAFKTRCKFKAGHAGPRAKAKQARASKQSKPAASKQSKPAASKL